MMPMKSKFCRGFSRNELFVVIGVFVGIAVIIVHKIAVAGTEANVSAAMNNGNQIYKFMTTHLDGECALKGGTIVSLPTTEEVKLGKYGGNDAAHYFGWLVTNKFAPVSYDFFSAPGVESAKDYSSFVQPGKNKLHNIWCVSLDIDEDRAVSGTPVLFTQNFNLPIDSTIDQLQTPGLKNRKPFGTVMGVVVQFGGAAMAIEQNYATPTNFCPVPATNKILWAHGSGPVPVHHSFWP